jgi:dCTP deaminase
MVGDRLVWSRFTVEDKQFQPASLDLRLGEEVYRVQCSFLPDKDRVQTKLDRYAIHSMSLIKGAVLEPGAVYLIPLMEQLRLPKGIRGRSNPRSTTGRLDVFTRIVTDHSDRFDEVEESYEGPLYLEVLSRSFPIRVTRFMSLSQLRFIRGNPRLSDSDGMSLYEEEPLLYEGDTAVTLPEIMIGGGIFLRASLSGIGGTELVGYKAKRNSGLVDLSQLNHYDLFDFWEPVFRDSKGRVILEGGEFYLFTSKEKVRIPPGYAAEMVAYDQASGELRTHYAGFFDPGFGYGSGGEVMGSVAVLEVRALDAPFMIEDGQRFCRLHMEKMASKPDYVYGVKEMGSSYQCQNLTPSKHFRVPSAKEIKKRVHLPEQLALLSVPSER